MEMTNKINVLLSFALKHELKEIVYYQSIAPLFVLMMTDVMMMYFHSVYKRCFMCYFSFLFSFI